MSLMPHDFFSKWKCAEARLDQAVFAAYGWPGHLSDEQILENLLALNLKEQLLPLSLQGRGQGEGVATVRPWTESPAGFLEDWVQ